jgi:integrase
MRLGCTSASTQTDASSTSGSAGSRRSERRNEAVALARIERREREQRAKLPPGERVTVAAYADQALERKRDGRLLTKQGRRFKRSSLDTWTAAARRVKAGFGDRSLASVTRSEAIAWAESQPAGVVAIAIALFGLAVDEKLIDRNPFRGLVRKGRGPADEDPPTPDEFDRLLDACSVLDDYAPQMRALMVVGAYTGMRPSKLFALEWADIDLAAHRIHVRRRVYKGELDLPKSNREKVIALPPPARDVLLRQPTRHLDLVFASKTGRRLSQPTLSGYWGKVKGKGGARVRFLRRDQAPSRPPPLRAGAVHPRHRNADGLVRGPGRQAAGGLRRQRDRGAAGDRCALRE